MGQSKLGIYRSKRDFRCTSEPLGEERGHGGYLFVVHKHDALHLHYDLRLQVGDVLKSWAIPKGPSVDPRERRLAVEVEEHPLEYGDFEGVIPTGEYGAGPTLVWDRGTWAPMGGIEESLRSGTLKFRLAGQKLKGGWTLARLKPRSGEKQRSWLLIKEHDDAAESKADILEERPESVLSGLVIEELLPAKSRMKFSPRLRPGAVKGAQKGAVPAVIKPQLASPVDTPPEGEAWLHEIKFDGYRTIAVVAKRKARLLTRNGHDWTARYGALADAFCALRCTTAAIDGEVVVLDERGVSRFEALQKALANGETWRLVFYAYDLLHLNGWDLSRVSLSRRKSLLEKLLGSVVDESSAIQFSDHVVGSGTDFFDRAHELHLEGVVSKRVDSTYRPGRSKTWLKAKAKRIGIFTIVGYTTSRAAGGLSALLLADETDGELCYAGKVGSGLSAAETAALTPRLESLTHSDPPLQFDKAQPRAKWVEPRLKATIHYTEKTRDSHLRHPVYRGLREPKFSGNRTTPTKRYITDEQLASIWVTNPERKMFSKRGSTKLDLAVYYAKVGDFMLPHIMQRPISLVRCPTGKVEDCFFQRHAFTGMPEDIGTLQYKTSDAEDRDYLFVNDAPGFLALAQFGVVEFHPWGCRLDKPERPDRMYFDLDPGEGVDWRDLVAAAGVLRFELERCGLTPFVKTSGGKGLHIVVPMKRFYSWKRLHQTSGSIAAALSKGFPTTFTTTMSKQKRKNRIFIDFHRNARSATAVAPYSLRASQRLPVSTPLSWTDLQSLDGPEDLNYATVPDLLTKFGDLWADLDARACLLSEGLSGKLSN